MLSDSTQIPITWLFGLGGGMFTIFGTFIIYFLKGIKGDIHEMRISIGGMHTTVVTLLAKDEAKDREIKELKKDLRILWAKLDQHPLA